LDITRWTITLAVVVMVFLFWFFKIAKNADYLYKPYIQIYPPIKQLDFALDRVKRVKLTLPYPTIIEREAPKIRYF
jgi:hypothetical protein